MTYVWGTDTLLLLMSSCINGLKLADQFVRRQDGWALLQEGVPTAFLSTSFGSQIVLGPYLASDYHGPGDEIGAIELGGAIDDLLLHEELVRRFANTATYSPPAKE